MRKVFVALSGGVDSSVAAALLAERGYAVTGVFIKGWHPDFLECAWKEDRLDAMRVCAVLRIPFYTLDLADAYKREVVDHMVRAYRKGRTPNPDVVCNNRIKFGAFLLEAKRRGAECIATGHYARLKRVDGTSRLYAALDSTKDQSYFLWGLGQRELSSARFPIGAYAKTQVREVAARYGLPTAAKKDSQGLCFLGKLDLKPFLSRYIASKPGAVLDKSGERVGVHDGIPFYTLGQRRGFRVDGPRAAHYVVEKDPERNTLTVAPAASARSSAQAQRVELVDVNWIAGRPPSRAERFAARVRHRGTLVPCRLECSNGRTYALFTAERPLAAPGQSLVLYLDREKDMELAGGGTVA